LANIGDKAKLVMLGLLPTELWDYGLADFGHAIGDALRARKLEGTLSIDDLGTCIPARSARAALVTALRALDLCPGARIGVPLYCCSVVFKAIEAAGCRPCFIDIEPDTFCMSAADLAAKRSQVQAVIAVHSFGNVCDIPALKEAALGKPIIEDCAQALGSMSNGRMVGSFGDISVFSFRSGKYLSVGEGGALFSNDAKIRSRAFDLISALPAPTRAEEYVHAAKTYLRSSLRSKPLYGVAGYALWERYNKKVQFSEKSPVALSQVYQTDLVLTQKRLAYLASAIQSQRANADYYACALKLDPGMLCRERPGTFYNRYQYPITFPAAKHRDFVSRYLHSRQIETSKPLDDIVDVATTHYDYSCDCPVAEQLSKRVLVIPSYHTLRNRDVECVARCLNQAWQELSSSAPAAESCADFGSEGNVTAAADIATVRH
jgi:perosamine synthetase